MGDRFAEAVGVGGGLEGEAVLAIVKAKLVANDFFIFGEKRDTEIPFLVSDNHQLADGRGYLVNQQIERLGHGGWIHSFELEFSHAAVEQGMGTEDSQSDDI